MTIEKLPEQYVSLLSRRSPANLSTADQTLAPFKTQEIYRESLWKVITTCIVVSIRMTFVDVMRVRVQGGGGRFEGVPAGRVRGRGEAPSLQPAGPARVGDQDPHVRAEELPARAAGPAAHAHPPRPVHRCRK